MKQLFTIAAIAALGGCTAQNPIWYQPETPINTASQSLAACEAKALALYPPKMASEPVVIGVNLGKTLCEGAMCVGLKLPTQTAPITKDLNKSHRQDHVAACMTDQGYRNTPVPTCPAGKPLSQLPKQPSSLKGVCLLNGQLYSPRP